MNIRVDLTTPITDGTEVVFRSPVDCSQITGLIVYYNESYKEFAFSDAHGNNVGDIDHLFAENAVVKVILDVVHAMAFVQNADTNAYIEKTFVKSVNGTKPDLNGNVTVVGGGTGGLTVTDDGNGNVTITGSGGITDDGDGNGTPGEDGGYYTPVVSQPEAGMMQIEWDASQTDMPSVAPQSVTLPVGPKGDPGDDYALTPEDKQEIAELAAGMVDVPSGEYRLIRKIVVDETNQTHQFTVSTDEDGNPFELEHLCVIADIPMCAYKSDAYVIVNELVMYPFIFSPYTDSDYWHCLQVDKIGENRVVMRGFSKKIKANPLAQYATMATLDGKISSVRWYTSSSSHVYPVGSTFEIYGY